MALPETDVARVQRWCQSQVPDSMRGQMRVEVDVADRHLTILECRPVEPDDAEGEWFRMPVARLRFTKSRREWSLFWADRNDRFLAYPERPPTSDVRTLLVEIDADPLALFWG